MATKIPNGSYSTSQYARNLSEYKAKEDAVSYWENLLQPATSTYNAELTQATQQRGYDISKAYQNYLNYETQLRNSNLLGTTVNQLSKNAEQDYQSSYVNALSNYYKTVGSATEKYQKSYESAYSDLMSEAGTIKSIDEAIKSYVADNYANMGYTEEDVSKMFQRTSTGEMELTDIGKQLYAHTLDDIVTDKNNPYYNTNVFFSELSESNPALYDYAVDNAEKLRSVLAGYTESDYNYKDYTKDKYDYSVKAKIGSDEYYKAYGIDYVDDKAKLEYLPNNKNMFEQLRSSISDLKSTDEIRKYDDKYWIYNKGFSQDVPNDVKKLVPSGSVIRYKGKYYVIINNGAHELKEIKEN